jgi:hypothetical protein
MVEAAVLSGDERSDESAIQPWGEAATVRLRPGQPSYLHHPQPDSGFGTVRKHSASLTLAVS